MEERNKNIKAAIRRFDYFKNFTDEKVRSKKVGYLVKKFRVVNLES
jgi:hypothetical protein